MSTNRLAEALGVAVPDAVKARIDERLAETADAVWRRLERAGGLMDVAERPVLELPAAMREVVEVALAHAEAQGTEAWLDHARQVELHYLEALPGARVEQLASRAAPNAWLFHSRLPWERLPRLRHAVVNLFRMVKHYEVDPTQTLGAADWEAWTQRHPTLGKLHAATYFGGSQGLFDASAPQLSALARQAEGTRDRWDVVDQVLSPAILHELMHFRRDRDALQPPYLDEALAGYFGLVLMRETAFPAPGEERALVGFPWFTQVGQAMARAFGDARVFRAHVGATGWDEVLGDGLMAAIRRLWWRAYTEAPAVHFHPDTKRPDLWARLMWAAASGRDVTSLERLEELDAIDVAALGVPEQGGPGERLMLRSALEMMCLRSEQRADMTWAVRMEPPKSPLQLDFHRGTMSLGEDRADGPVHVLPPGLCARLVERGQDAYALSIGACNELAVATLVQHLEGLGA